MTDDEQFDAESQMWLNAALTPPLEPVEWGPEGEPKGYEVEFVPGEGLYVDADDDQAWLESGLADLQAHLDEIERDIPAEELRAWLESFKPQKDGG